MEQQKKIKLIEKKIKTFESNYKWNEIQHCYFDKKTNKKIEVLIN